LEVLDLDKWVSDDEMEAGFQISEQGGFVAHLQIRHCLP
jgi:hypothetical protein